MSEQAIRDAPPRDLGHRRPPATPTSTTRCCGWPTSSTPPATRCARAPRLGAEVLADDDVADSAELSPATYAQAEDDIRAATTGKHGLLARSVELDADALVVRATVLTYRWIDELQDAAYRRSARSPAARSATSPPRWRSAARSSRPASSRPTPSTATASRPTSTSSPRATPS